MKPVSLLKGLFVCVLFFAFATHSLAQEGKPQSEEEQSVETQTKRNPVSRNARVEKLFERWNHKTTPGVSVAVVKDGEVVYRDGFGMANLEYEIPNTPETVFHIASVSKQFTNFAVLLLENKGKLSLDDDIRKHIPEVPEFGKTITLRHLAHHTSGLRDQWELLGIAGWRSDDVITKNHIMKLVQKQQALNFSPGDEFMYCNTGYTLLAEVVARVSGLTFAEFTKKHIFVPLEMDQTLFYDDHEIVVKNRAYSYKSSDNGFKKSVLSYANVGATSLFTTADDLSKWAMNFENPVVGNQEIFEAMRTKGKLNNGKSIPYALGQMIGEHKGLKEISHGGADAGYRAFLARFPEQQLSVIVLSNDGSFGPSAFAYKVADIFLEESMSAKTNTNSVEPKASGGDSTEVEVTVDAATLKKYVGKYELRPGLVITAMEVKGELFLQATGRPRWAAKAISETRFQLESVGAEVSFHKDSSEEFNLLKLNRNGQTTDAPRQSPFDEESVDLSDFVGKFHSNELSTDYTFVVEEGKLVANHPRHDDVNLTPVKKDCFQTQRLLGQVKFVRDERNVVSGFEISNGRVRNLVFSKADD